MEIEMLVVGSKVIQRKQSFLYIAARGEVIGIKLVNGQPAAQVHWRDGWANWEGLHDVSALKRVRG